MLSEIPVAFHNDSNDDYRFIIKELENKFYEKFEYLGENRVKCKTFFGFNRNRSSFSSWISMGSSFKKYWSKIGIINWYQFAINGCKMH